ncbi:MAG: hypothetical protein HYW90_01500 [Candidatus Sungbacteria bacterium]|nr:hypothetical protein [Candidatus Sungbacteria bacterium]
MFTSENFKKVADLVYKDYYKYLFKHAVSLLRRSRLPYLRRNNLWIGGIQQNMVKYRLGFEETVRKGKSMVPKDDKEKKALDIALRSNKEFLRVLKDIGDGIAWRNLDYRRSLIRLMSEHAPTGDIGPDAERLILLLGARKKVSDRVIINDLTHCLKIADLTVITSKSRIFIYEVKARKDKTEIIGISEISRRIQKYGQARKQAISHWIVQDAFINKKVKTPKLEIRIVDLDFVFHTHISKVNQLIKESDNKNFSNALLEGGYHIEICALDKVFEKSGQEKIKEQLNKLKPFNPHKEGWSDMTLCISNYDTFYSSINDRFTNFTPYSVLPLSARNCVRLTMGQLYIRICFDFMKLKQKFEEAGWSVEVKDWTSWESQNKETIRKIREGKGGFLEHSVNEYIFKISKQGENGRYTQDFPVNLVIIMLSAFYTTDYLIGMAEAVYQDAKLNSRGGGLSTFNCLYERCILR